LKIGPATLPRASSANGKQTTGRDGKRDASFSGRSLRLADPPEFDVMGRVVALRLRERWGRLEQ